MRKKATKKLIKWLCCHCLICDKKNAFIQYRKYDYRYIKIRIDPR